jgi:glucosamine--fructose-6-phosphate aminotransferase (isomerizing)
LIEEGTPVIAMITQSKTAGLVRSNVAEVQSRGANAVIIASQDLAKADDAFVLPNVEELLMPLVSVIPSQLLAYYATLDRGQNVDRPRNLAKSVTVQ